MSPAAPGLLLYDLDGTLIDSRADLATAVNLGRAGFGLAPLPAAAVVAAIGEGLHTLVLRTFADAPVDVETAVDVVRRHYAQHLLDATLPYPGVREALAELQAAGFLQAVVTNKPRPATLAILEGLGIATRFDAVVGGGDASALKPDPAPLRLAAERLGYPVDAPCVWMAGDHFTDLAAARQAGVRRCFCRYGFGDPRDERWDLAVDDLRELARHVLAQAG